MVLLIAPKELNGLFVHKATTKLTNELEIATGTIEGDISYLLLDCDVPTAVGTDYTELSEYAVNNY